MTNDKQPVQLTGFDLLKNPQCNESTAFSEKGPDRNKFRGLLPVEVSIQSVQIKRVLENLRRKIDDV